MRDGRRLDSLMITGNEPDAALCVVRDDGAEFRRNYERRLPQFLSGLQPEAKPARYPAMHYKTTDYR